MVKEIGRNDPCPCGSGKKYKKCCLGTEKDPLLKVRTQIVKCSICEKNFDSNIAGTFQSIEKEGERIYFCPGCNLNLRCSVCKKKLGTKSFDLFSCPDCGAITVICNVCMEKGDIPEGHHKIYKSFLHRWLGLK
jgi:hypothetical protein